MSVAVSGNLSAGISSLLMEAAVAGCGIAMLPELEARRALNSGALKQVLPGYTPKIPRPSMASICHEIISPARCRCFWRPFSNSCPVSARAVYTYSFNVKKE